MLPWGARVSVVVPIHDRAAMLGDLIRSMTAQTWPNIELVIVDIDASLAGPFFETHCNDPGNFLRDVEWPTHAALYRRETIADAGGYDEALRIGEDTLMQLRIRLAHGAGARIDAVVGVRRRHAGGQFSLGPIAAADRHRFLIAVAPLITEAPQFQAEARAVRLTSLAVFLLILAGDGQQPPALCLAFDRIAGVLLHDMPKLRGAIAALTAAEARTWLAAAGGVIRSARAARAAAIRLRRLRGTTNAAPVIAQIAALRAVISGQAL